MYLYNYLVTAHSLYHYLSLFLTPNHFLSLSDSFPLSYSLTHSVIRCFSLSLVSVIMPSHPLIEYSTLTVVLTQCKKDINIKILNNVSECIYCRLFQFMIRRKIDVIDTKKNCKRSPTRRTRLLSMETSVRIPKLLKVLKLLKHSKKITSIQVDKILMPP